MKLLIVDDEPLVQVGIKSILNWSDIDIEICGTAQNGQVALDMIEKHRPDIIISDIQMPVMDGLILMKESLNKYGAVPVFILLTSYEEFDYVKTALKYQAIDYLIKLDLTKESLMVAIKKAKEKVSLHSQSPSSKLTERENMLLFRDRFYSKLLNNLFQAEDDLTTRMKNLNITLDYFGYAVAQMTVISNKTIKTFENNNQDIETFNNALQLFKELILKYIPCKIVILDANYCAIIFCFEETDSKNWREKLETSLLQIDTMIYNYYNVHLSFCIGRFVEKISEIHLSYYDAKQLLSARREEGYSLFFYDDHPSVETLRNVVNLSLFRDDISKAFGQSDKESLDEIFNNIFSLLEGEKSYYLQALDFAVSVLHLSINMLPNGGKIVSNIFNDYADNYHSLYRLQTVEQIISWLKHFRDGLFIAFDDIENNSENYLISHVKKYIEDNLREKLLLQDIAKYFDVSHNYLSQLFKKTTGGGINEYISQMKINEAKKLLLSDNRKIYEISEEFGFESAFYFSKVFKKHTGVSPKQFRNRG